MEASESLLEPLIFDLVESVSRRRRAYDEVMNAWRTSCPRFPVWEEANSRGFVTTVVRDGQLVVEATPAGLMLVAARLKAAT